VNLAPKESRGRADEKGGENMQKAEGEHGKKVAVHLGLSAPRPGESWVWNNNDGGNGKMLNKGTEGGGRIRGGEKSNGRE